LSYGPAERPSIGLFRRIVYRCFGPINSVYSFGTYRYTDLLSVIECWL